MKYWFQMTGEGPVKNFEQKRVQLWRVNVVSKKPTSGALGCINNIRFAK